MKKLAQILISFFVLGTFLSLFRFTDWWIRAWDFPRPQIALAGFFLLLIYLWLWDRRRRREIVLLVLLAASIVYQGARILPYTPLYPKQVFEPPAQLEVDPGDRVTLMVVNVLMENRQSDRMLALVREWQPDVLLVVEPDSWWQERLRVLEGEMYPHTLQHPLPNTYGMLLYSRLPLLNPSLEFLIEEDIPSMHADLQLRSGRQVRFHGVHPRPPSPTEAEDSVERDGELLQVAMRVRDHGRASIVMGDLNDVAWSSTTALMKRVGGLLDPRVGRGLYSTFHAEVPVMRWPLDHTFHTDHFYLLRLERLPFIGSDHFPIFVELLLAQEAHQEHEAEPAEPEDVERADEKIDEALEPDP